MIQGKDQARGKREGGVRVKTERIGTLGKTLLGRRTMGNKSLIEERGCEKQEQGKIETSESRKKRNKKRKQRVKRNLGKRFKEGEKRTMEE